MDILIIFGLVFVFFLAGFIDSIAGGGGLLALPSLLLAGISPQFALGTNKFAATFGTTAALFNFTRGKKVIWKIALIGVVFSLIGSVIGTKAILLLNPSLAGKIILILLPVAAVFVFIPKKQIKSEHSSFSNANLYIHTPLICLGLGIYDGFFGPGTGTFLIIFFYVFLGMHMVNASATAKVFNLASNIGALATFAISGKVIYAIGIPIALANLCGGYLGSHLAIKKGQKIIKVFLIVAFALLFVTLAVKYSGFW